MVFVLFCASVKQNDDEQSQQGKRNVAIDAPGKRSVCLCPRILWEHTKRNSYCCEQVNGPGNAVIALNLVSDSPYIVQQDIKDSHGDGGDPLSDSQSRGKGIQTSGAKRHCTRNEMEGVTSS